jgi:cellulose synthase/poly-beta-1,6-N-acetylglucosamine synthase-like glycosyltransferase
VGGSAFLILLGICIQLSINISGLQRQLHDVNEVVALLRDKVENDPADKTNTLIIIPAYNEQESIVAVIEVIKATGFPFVVIDDGSTDETRTREI